MRVRGLKRSRGGWGSLNSRVVPLRAAMETKDLVAREAALKAERCLLYVALTSAKQTATIAMETCPRS